MVFPVPVLGFTEPFAELGIVGAGKTHRAKAPVARRVAVMDGSLVSALPVMLNSASVITARAGEVEERFQMEFPVRFAEQEPALVSQRKTAAIESRGSTTGRQSN